MVEVPLAETYLQARSHDGPHSRPVDHSTVQMRAKRVNKTRVRSMRHATKEHEMAAHAGLQLAAEGRLHQQALCCHQHHTARCR